MAKAWAKTQKGLDKQLSQQLAKTARANQNIASRMVEQKYGKVTSSHNLDAIIQQYQTLNYPQSVDLTVFSDVPYASFVEFGTTKMTPRAMIRRSTPEIQAFIGTETTQLPPLASADQIVEMSARVGEFAVSTISKNTPRSDEVKDLHLQDSFQARLTVRK